MATRRPNLRNAAFELAIAGAAFVAGLEGSISLAVIIAAAAGAYWGWTRRGALAAMAPAQLARMVAISLAVLIGVVAFCYALGLLFKGMMG